MDLPLPYENLAPEIKALLRFAPDYALPQAYAAVVRAGELQRQGLLAPGVHYLVLADLVGSTTYMATHGNAAADARIQDFVTACTASLSAFEGRNLALFVKEIGDAALFVFQHFPDVLKWHATTSAALNEQAITFRTVVNAGEVWFNGINPIALAVSQLFKIEKHFGAGEIGMTDITFAIAAPSVDDVHLRFVLRDKTVIDGLDREVELYSGHSEEIPDAVVEAWDQENEDLVEENRDW